MLRLFLSAIIGILFFFLFSYVLIYSRYPASITNLGYINFMATNTGALIGGLAGALMASYFAFTPSLLGYIKKFKKNNDKLSFPSPPKSTTGQVTHKQTFGNNTTLNVVYDNHQKNFELDSRVVPSHIQKNSQVSVFYDPNDKNKSYLDLNTTNPQQTMYSSPNQLLNEPNFDAVFKLIEITPKFDLGNGNYELIGELFGEGFNGDKSSLIAQFQHDQLSTLIPGKLFPCIVSGEKENLSIQLKLH